MDIKELYNRFTYHAPDKTKADLHSTIRAGHFLLVNWLNDVLPEGREKALVMTKLEESMFWANAAIARN